MAYSAAKWLERLTAQQAVISPEDPMPEAGRKALLDNLIQILSHEEGTRTGADIEDVHQMRVATRRSRSIFRLMQHYFSSKETQTFQDHLKYVAGVLGRVRDLDVMIENLMQYQNGLDETQQNTLQSVIDQLSAKRDKARGKLTALLDSKKYQRFIKDYARFLKSSTFQNTTGSNGSVTPYEVRHVAPVLIHEKLAAVKAYDTILNENLTPELLHSLRIEFKRLRYAVALFDAVLGTSGIGFIEEVKTMQDYLGHLNDAVVAEDTLTSLNLDEETTPVIEAYIAYLQQQVAEKLEQFPEIWAHFNKRTVQRKLSDSLLILR